MRSQLGPAAVSDGEEDGVSLLEGVPHGRLDSAPPALQLRTSLQDVPAAGRRLQTRSVRCAGSSLASANHSSHLHELTERQQVGHADVVPTQEGLSAQERGLQLVQSVPQLGQSPAHTLLVHRGAGLDRKQHLRGWGHTGSADLQEQCVGRCVCVYTSRMKTLAA